MQIKRLVLVLESNTKTDSYFEVDGKPLGEKNPKWLNDDYVKFIRFSQWRIDQTGYGVLAFVTNHGYLDNPTFRGMRQSLLKTFDEIYILDLHGNSKKKETCPDDSVDQNVFDIQQGVAIGIFVKYQNSEQKSTTVYHADLWGKREVFENKQLIGGKYHWLDESDISSTQWKKLQPDKPFYLFKPQNIEQRLEYGKFWKINDVMLINNAGMVSKRDSLAFQFEKESVKKIVTDIFNLSEAEIIGKYPLSSWDSRDGKVEYVRKSVKEYGLDESRFIEILYRSFDKRWTYYTPKSKGFIAWPVYDVMKHFLPQENLGLVTLRRPRNEIVSNFFVTNAITDKCVISSLDNASIFPLYLYPIDTILKEKEFNTRRPNLAPEFINELSEKLGLEFSPDGKGDQVKTFAPEDIFNYIYATFHSPTYRQRYAEFLKIDFPRVPLTSNKKLFWELATKGDRLVQLHLMKETGAEISSYPIDGSNLVEQVKYNETQQQIWINDQQYFANIPNHIWNFYIGGYQVCQKWLKDRKGRELSFDDLVHYQNIISILDETVLIMSNIDQIINQYGGFPLS